MPEKLYSTGVPTAEQLASVAPSAEELARGPVLMIECFQKIPCDPCHTSCPTGAVLPFDELNDLPRTDPSKCTGCGLCVVACPGLAITILDLTKGEADEAVVRIPWEYLPVPENGDEVVLTNRSAEVIGKGSCLKARRFKDSTWLLDLLVPKELAMEARGISLSALREAKGAGNE